MTPLQHLRTLRKQAQFPYGPQSLHQHAPAPPAPPPPAPPPPPDPNVELQAQLEETGAQIQQMTQEQQQAQAELQSHKLQAQQYKAEAQLAKREADLTRREAELTQQTADSARQVEEQARTLQPHLSPAATERIKAINKHVQRLNKRANTQMPAGLDPDMQRNWASARALSGTDPGTIQGPGADLVQQQASALKAPAPTTPDGRYNAQWLETGKHPGLQGNWFNRNITNRALNLWRPVAVGGQRMEEHARDGNYLRAAGSALVSGGHTAMNIGFGPVGVGTALAFDSGGQGAGSRGSTQALADRATQELAIRDRARAWDDFDQGLARRYDQNLSALNSNPDYTLQQLQQFGPYAPLAQGNRNPAFTAHDYRTAQDSDYGHPLLNFILPLISQKVVGSPRPSYQNGTPFTPGQNLTHTPGGMLGGEL